MSSFTADMLDDARRGGADLGVRAAIVTEFIHAIQADDGGFRGRDGRTDLYYTLFGLQCARALDIPLDWERVAAFLGRTDDRIDDLTHAASLARCWALLPRDAMTDERQAALLSRIAAFRAQDGGYALLATMHAGSVYGSFLAFLAYQDFDQHVPHPERVLACIRTLCTGDGGYANVPDTPLGTTPVTAAALVLTHALGGVVDATTIAWLIARHETGGGFTATPGAPVPDLLSTATALSALIRVGAPLSALRESCRRFVLSLFDDRGGFHGTRYDDMIDCEYTFYGLLALGCLARVGA
jgi:hypothetical protein